MDGKLDYQEGTVLMNHPANSVYQQVSTKGELSPHPTSIDSISLFLSLRLRSLNVPREVFSVRQY